MENLTTGMQPAFLLLIFHSVEGGRGEGVGGDGVEKASWREKKSHFKAKRTTNEAALLEEWTENEERK